MPTPAATPGIAFWRLPIAGLLEQLGATTGGLSRAEATARLAKFGPNVTSGERKRAVVLQFLAKFLNPLVIILLVASAISGATGDRVSFIIISAIVLMSVTLDFVQEHRAGQAAERLRDSVAVRATGAAGRPDPRHSSGRDRAGRCGPPRRRGPDPGRWPRAGGEGPVHQ